MSLATFYCRRIGIWGLIPLCIGLCLPLGLQAVPANPEAAEVEQPDGKKIKIHLRGDEYFSWHEDVIGFVIQKDDKDKFWKYATPKKNAAEFDVVPEGIVGKKDPASLQLKKGDLPKPEKLREHIKKARESVVATPVPLSVATISSAEDETQPSTPDLPPPQGISVSGTKTIKNIVILACFSDHWTGGNNSTNTTYTRIPSEFTNLFNQVGHNTDGAVGSVWDYYSEVSYGKLTVDSLVVPWVQLSTNQAYYGADGTSKDTNWKEMITEAIAGAEAAGFDFSQGDSDGDGWLDCLTVIHSGYGQEYSGNSTECIWSKQGEITSTATNDVVKMKRVHTEPAMRGDDNPASRAIIRIGVICHEMGHFFGLPDLYDYSNKTHGLGYWSVMAGGSWNGSSGNSPAHFDAWCKGFLGFVNVTPVHSMMSMSLPRAEDNAIVKLLRDGTSNGEYFLVENRAKTGFDNTSEIYPGILIYHVDSKSANNDLNTWAHPVVKIEEADGNDSLGKKIVQSEAGDVWTSTSGLSGGFKDMTSNTNTSSMLYQAGYYVRTNNDAFYTFNTLSNFSVASSTMFCDLLSLKTTVNNQTTNSASYTLTWPSCANATYYEIQEGVLTNVTSFSDGAEDEDAMYDNWYLGGTIKRSSSGKNSGTYSYAMQYYDGSKWGASVQSLTMHKTFQVTPSTIISFYVISHIVSGSGYIKYQISNDNGDTWKTLATDGYVSLWTARSYNYTALSSIGINSGDQCLLRFVANFEYASYYPNFPLAGFALDDISITGVLMTGYTNWSTLSSSVPSASYGMTDKLSGTYAYRVRAFANSAWQGYGGEGICVVNNVTSNSVAYDGNGNTSGAVPVDSNSPYLTGSTVTVLGNTNELAKTGYTFSAWNTATNGSGLAYAPGATFTITNNTTLYAQWIGKSVTLLSISAIAPYTYDGSPKNPLPAVTDGALLLTNSINYLLSYTNNVNAGTATLTLTGLGYYYGTTNTSFTINPATPTITNWPAATTLEIGQALSNAVLSGASASVTGTFSFLSPTNIPPVGVYTAAVTFVASDSGNYASVTGSVVITVIDIYAVPFQETFESRTQGDLDGQYGWVAEGTIVQTNTTFNSSTNAAQISEGSGYLKHLFTDGRTKVWFDARFQGVQSPEKPTPDTNATVAVYVSTNALVMAFNGTNVVSTGITVQTNEWIRLTVFSDYTTKKYTLYVNDIRVDKYDFYNAGVTNFTEIKVSGDSTFVDNVGITPNQPGMQGMPSLILLQ